MTTLPTIPSGRDFRFVEITGDNMEPMLRRRDYAMVVSASRYDGAGYYGVQTGFGEEFYVCNAITRDGCRDVRLHPLNRHYSDQFVSLQEFNRIVTGKIAMACNVVDLHLLQSACNFSKAA